VSKKLFLFLFLINLSAFSQEVIWIGTINTDFFNELNWKFSNSNESPNSGTIDSNIAIPFDLKIENTNQLIKANGTIHLGNKSLILENSTVQANTIFAGTIHINNNAYLDLESENPLQGNFSINLNAGIGWVRTKKLDGNTINSNFITQIKVNNQTASYKNNLRLDNYYLKGTVLRSYLNSTAPLAIFDKINVEGNSANLTVNKIHSGNNIPNNLNNKIHSFKLKKGFMVTIASEADGTGKSKNYIASEEDLIINELPEYLQNNISFFRIVPWNWANKKGVGGNFEGMNQAWFYNWGNSSTSTLDKEYVPMSWGAGGANDDDDITKYKSKFTATHVLGFNESDNCDDQSGQYSNLCQTDVAVGYYKNLMKTGLRLVSPNGRENAPFGWLKEFHQKATAQDVRIDVIGVHWYDWGSTPKNSPNANPATVFNRFKNYLQRVYDLYKLPIWITEFNANPNRTTSVNYEFMKLALPYLENLEYVERYAWFQPNSDVADYYDSNNNYTEVGTFYKNQISTPAVTKSTITADNNLDLYYNKIAFQTENVFINGDFETGDLTGWSGSSSIDILTTDAVYEGSTSGRIKSGAGNIYQEVTVESLTKYDLSFYTKWYTTPTSPIEIQILNAANDEKIASKMMTTSTDWNLVTFSFLVPENVISLKILFQKESSPGWFIDYALLKKNSNTLRTFSYDFEQNLQLYPNPTKNNFTIRSLNVFNAYAIYNAQGKLILHKENLNSLVEKIELENIAKGLYTVLINHSNQKKSVRKVILN
tara:strand:+ start:105466 stop:107763 length:2298 start_codon:yes stop_codon:yes gene_type:complete